MKKDPQCSQQRKKLPMHWDPVQLLSTCLCSSLAAIFSRLLWALASGISAQRSSSLRGCHWTQPCLHSWTQVSNCSPASLLLPGVHFLALASSISYSTLTLTRSYIYSPIHNSPWFQVVLALPSISCPKPTSLNLMVPKLLRKGLLFCFFHTKAVEVHQKPVTGTHTKFALASASSI